MHQMNMDKHQQMLHRAFIGLHFMLAGVLFVESLLTSVHAFTHADWAFAAFASVEAVAALLFLHPRTMRIGGSVLILILLTAFGIHLLRSEVELPLLVYVVGMVFIMVHGAAHRTVVDLRIRRAV